MPHILTGRVAAITGASAGIGLACAHAFAAEGMKVVLGARRQDRLDEAVAAIERAGGTALAVVMDVTREADARLLVDRTLAAFGTLDVMVCNAGIGFHGSTLDTDTETMKRLMDVNYMGTFHAVRAALNVMTPADQGHIVIMSSIAGRRGIPHMGAYSATKFAQIGLAEGLRAELAGTGIRVSVVCPISTRSEFLDTMASSFGHSVSGVGPKQGAEDVARAVVSCVRRPRAEVHPYALSRVLAAVSAIAPGVADRLVQRYARSRRVTRDV